MRSLGTIPQSAVQANTVALEWFLVITIPAPVSLTVRYTTKQGGFVGNIDGTSQTWSEPPGGALNVDGLTQGEQNPLALNTLQIGNMDSGTVFSGYVLQVGSVRGWACGIYYAQFNPTTGALLGVVPFFTNAQLDAFELGDVISLTVVPQRDMWTQKVPRRRTGTTCANRFKDPRTCQYVGIVTTCDHTRGSGGCGGLSNLVHFMGDDLAPKPGSTISWGDVKRQIAQKTGGFWTGVYDVLQGATGVNPPGGTGITLPVAQYPLQPIAPRPPIGSNDPSQTPTGTA